MVIEINLFLLQLIGVHSWLHLFICNLLWGEGGGGGYGYGSPQFDFTNTIPLHMTSSYEISESYNAKKTALSNDLAKSSNRN